MTPLWRLGAAEIARRVQGRALSAREVVREHLDRLFRVPRVIPG